MQGLTDEERSAIERAEKLFRLAAKNTNEHEAAAAIAKATELLAAYNLDASIIEQGGGEKSKRADEKLKGGLYHFQRDLWHWVAALNFCLYWSVYRYDPNKKNLYQSRRRGYKVMGGWTFEHRLVGRAVNVIAAKGMAEYLEQTIERLTKDRLMDVNSRNQGGYIEALWGEWAVQYRTGIADSIIQKLADRRNEFLREEEKKELEARERAAQAAKSGVSTSTALVMSSLVQSERDANLDFLNGEGWSARQRAKKEERARVAAEAEAAYAKWATEHPEEAAKAAEEDRKARKREPWNKGMGDGKDHRKYGSAYYAGREVGEGVSIDPQVSDPNSIRKLASR